MENFKTFLKKKDIEISAKRYGIDALGAMAQGLFASLLIGTIIATIGEQAGVKFLVEIGTYAKASTGPAMAIAIGYALHCPPLVLFSLAAVGAATNTLGGAGGPLAVLIVTIFASELGKLVSKETKIDIIATPFVTITAGILLAMWWAPGIGKAAVPSAMPSCGQPNSSHSSWVLSFPLLSVLHLPFLSAVLLYVPHSDSPDWQAELHLPDAVPRWSVSQYFHSVKINGADYLHRESEQVCFRWEI